MDITYLTQKSAQANNANPIIIDVKRARIVGLSEPEEGARFNGAILKALSGGDYIVKYGSKPKLAEGADARSLGLQGRKPVAGT